jgi:NADH-quinone oxidoreductase subunit N
MNSSDVIALLPMILPSCTAILILLLIAIKRNHALVASCAVAGLAASFASLRAAATVIPRSVTALLVVDSYSLFYSGFLIVTAALVVVLSFSYFQRRREHREEFYALILLATVGTIVLTASRHFASLFLGIEILSVSLYALVSYLREGKLALEAGIKYLVLAATSSAFLLFGLALLYAETGSMDLATVSYILMKPISGTAVGIELAGIIFIVTGIGFKLAAGTASGNCVHCVGIERRSIRRTAALVPFCKRASWVAGVVGVCCHVDSIHAVWKLTCLAAEQYQTYSGLLVHR